MKECTDVVLTRNQASKYVSMGNCCLFRLEQGIVFHGQFLTVQISITVVIIFVNHCQF